MLKEEVLPSSVISHQSSVIREEVRWKLEAFSYRRERHGSCNQPHEESDRLLERPNRLARLLYVKNWQRLRQKPIQSRFQLFYFRIDIAFFCGSGNALS